MLRYRQPHRLKQRQQGVLKRLQLQTSYYNLVITNTPNEVEAGFYTDKLAKTLTHIEYLKKNMQLS